MTRRPLGPELHLPDDLVAFLTEGKQLEYDPATTAAGAVTLKSLSELKLERFPVETSGDTFEEEDPNLPERNSYLVLGVSLIATCEHFAPAGILLWLPVERRFGAWDGSHCKIEVFAEEVTWARVVASPGPHLEASCGGDGFDPPFERLVPWHSHPYSNSQVYKPQPAEPVDTPDPAT